MKSLVYDYLKYRNIKYSDDMDIEVEKYIADIKQYYPNDTKDHLRQCLNSFDYLDENKTYVYFHNYSLIKQLQELHEKIEYAYYNSLDYYFYLLQYEQAYSTKKDNIESFAISPNIMLDIL